VAVFLEIARKEVGDKTVIWALNTDAEAIKKEITNVEELGVDETIKKIIKNDKSLTYCDKTSINDCAVVFSILENKKDGIYIINPFRLIDRLTIQQGVFVIPCNIKKSFMGNLNIPEKTKSELLKKYVLEIDSKFQKDLLSHLRQMNINSAVLFPGLQGFAESLWMRAGCTMTGKLWNKDIEEKLQLYTDQ
jgi:tRNA U34 5-carboxymethylaminomethyl modifying GTPase MnmE/TrmE